MMGIVMQDTGYAVGAPGYTVYSCTAAGPMYTAVHRSCCSAEEH